MKFHDFEKAARRAYEEIPDEYKEGIDGFVVSREALAHPTLPDVFTLGHCSTEDYASDYGGPETTRSQLVLYWGSFHELARRNPDFDWEGEVWETLTHELRHHLESLARDDTLEGVDYALDETFKRDEGLDFDPWYYQYGEELGGGVYRAENNFYLEQVWRAEDFESATHVDFSWHGQAYRVERPPELGEVHFLWVDGLDTGDQTVELVLVRKRSWWEDAKRLFGTSRTDVWESRGVAEPVSGEG